MSESADNQKERIAKTKRSKRRTTGAHKRAEEAPLKKDQFLHKIIELTPIVLGVFNLVTQHYTYFSNGTVSLFGYAPEEIATIDDLFSALLHPEDLPGAQENIEQLRVLNDGEVNDFECRIRRRDGEWRWIVIRSMPFARAEDGSVSEVIVVTLDVTKRKIAEEALKRSEERFRRLIENSSDIISMFTLDGTIRYESPSITRILGYQPEELIGRSVFEFIHLSDVSQMNELKNTSQMGSDVKQNFSCRFRHKNGSWRVLEGVGKTIVDESGELIAMFSSRDVTGRKQAEDALEIERQRLRLAQAVAGIGTWEWDMSANRVTWSENMGPLFGLARGFSPGPRENFLELVVPEDRGGIAASLRRTLEEGAPHEVLFRTIWPDGSQHWLSAKGCMLRDDHDRPFKVLGATMDVTERMQTEQARQAELDRTKAELRALTMNLLTAQEDERRRIARELHDDISQRLARLQIELEMLRQKPPADPMEVASRLRPLAQEVSETSDDLRRLSHRLHSGVLEDLGLEVGLRSLVEDFQQSFGLAATLTCDELPFTIPMAIATALYRIVQEALRNVVKHAPGSVVYIQVSKMPEGLQLLISDSGPGFDPDAGRGKRGLGIISMQERAKLVGGSLAIRSRPGEGTQLEMIVPLEPRTVHNRPRVLIVDDDAEIRQMLRRIVEDASGEVVGEAEHGRAAIEVAEELQPDMILLDVSMPVMGGFPAARELRRRLPGAQIVFVSQYSGKAYADEALQCGASAYVLKSAAATDLPDVIRTLTAR